MMPGKQTKNQTGKGKTLSKKKTARDLSVSESAVKNIKGGTFCRPNAAPSSRTAQQRVQNSQSY